MDEAEKIVPDPQAAGLTEQVVGEDQNGTEVTLPIVVEKPLTIFLGDAEIVTAMTIGDYPEYLALGYLRNQRILMPSDRVEAIEYDATLGVVVVRVPDLAEARVAGRKIRTSGCAEGTMFEAFMQEMEQVQLDDTGRLHTSDLYALTSAVQKIPSLYLAAGAIHGCVLAHKAEALAFFEDVGRHNAVDKISGYMAQHNLGGADLWLYTTGRLTSEMVLKAVNMGVPIVASRSGFTAAGVSLARQANLTLIGRARGHRFTVLSGGKRIVRDAEVRQGDNDKGKQADD